MNNCKFTAEMDKFISDNSSKMTASQIAAHFDMKLNTVKNRARVIGAKFSSSKPRWTERQDALLKDMAGHHPVSQIAAACRKTNASVNMRASVLGLNLAYHRKSYNKLTTVHIKEARRLRDIGLSFNQIAQVMYLPKSTVRQLVGNL